jgi:hypothetical protein
MASKVNSNQEIPKKEIIGDLEYSFFRVGAFRAAIELRLWEKIAAGEDTAAKIVEYEGWDLAGTRLLLDAMCSLELLSKAGDRYALVPEAAFYLVPEKPTYIGDMLLYECHWDGNDQFSDTTSLPSTAQPRALLRSGSGLTGATNSSKIIV